MRTLLVALLCVLTLSASAQIRSVQSGKWSNKETWGGKTPGSKDEIIISQDHSIEFDVEETTISGMEIDGTLFFNDAQTGTLQSSKNIVVRGLLKMRPSSHSVINTIRFVEINESKYVGGGHEVLATDVGLWVMGEGQLELVGTSKGKGWTNAQASISKGSNAVLIKDNVDWLVGDDIVVTPTEAPTSKTFETSFDESQIASTKGNQINLTTATKFNHPAVANRWTAEVLNLTRNVRVQGTPGGRAHILIRSMKPQQVSWVELRHMGPRKNRNSDKIPDMVPGRYALHFHHSMDGSRGSVLVGNVVRDCGNHGYVPHISNGITFKGNVSYNTLETPYWWDPKEISHDIIYDGNIAAKATFVARSVGLNPNGGPSYGSEGFLLGMGDGNVANNNVVVGQQSRRDDLCGGYIWQADNEGIWEFKNNLAHNSTTGIRVWQNTHFPHVIENFEAYHSTMGVHHGAYTNSYRYVGGILYGCAFDLRAASASQYSLRIENMIFDGAGIVNHMLLLRHSKLTGTRPTVFRNVKMMNYLRSAVSYETKKESKPKVVDFVNCDLGNRDFTFINSPLTGERLRVQPALGRPYQINRSGRTFISEFAPKVWGEGMGLTGKYFRTIDLKDHKLTRVDPVLFKITMKHRLHYSITDDKNYSASWEGKLMPQFNEPLKLHLESGGGHRVYLDGKLIFNSWMEKYPREFTSNNIQVEAGKLYTLRIEYFNAKTDQSRATLRWSSASLPKEVIPQSQLYPADEREEVATAMKTDNNVTEVAEAAVTKPGQPESCESKISIYPTPSNGSITLSGIKDELVNTRIEVMSSSGNRVFEMQNKTDKVVRLNLQHLTNGVYFVWIKGKAKPVIERIVIQK